MLGSATLPLPKLNKPAFSVGRTSNQKITGMINYVDEVHP